MIVIVTRKSDGEEVTRYAANAITEAGIIPPEASLVDAKLIDDTYFMVKLG